MEDLALLLRQLLSENMKVGVSAARHLEGLRTDTATRVTGGYTTDSKAEMSYADTIRATVGAPEFATRDFLLALLEFMELAQEQQTQLLRAERMRQKARSEAILARLSPQSSEEEQQKARRLLNKVASHSSGTPNSNEELQAQWLERQTEADFIFGCLGAELLAVSDKLRRWANIGERQHQVCEALERMDVTAKREFLADALALMDRSDPYGFAFVNALALGVRDDEETLRSLVERVKRVPGSRAVNPLLVLRAVGPRVAELVPNVFPILLEALDYPQSRSAAVGALGAIGSQSQQWSEHIVLVLLDLSRSNDAHIQSAAIEALGELHIRPDLVVPRLIEALDDYEDPDPDNYYGSEHLVVTKALQAFGSLAVPAVPALLRHLRDEEGQRDVGVIKTLKTIGSVAAGFETVKKLENLALEWAKECELPVEEILRRRQYHRTSSALYARQVGAPSSTQD